MTNEAILRELKARDKARELEEVKGSIMNLRLFLHTLRVLHIEKSYFNFHIYIEKYKV